MELIVLKIPPEHVALLTDALQRDLNTSPPPEDAAELTHILVWLRYRHGKWLARKSLAEQANQKPDRTTNH